MRTINSELVQEYADELKLHLPLARRAVGVQRPDSPARRASDRVNELILEYAVEKGGNMTHLAYALEGHISLPGLRRRLRTARSKRLGAFTTSSKRASTDPELVKPAAEKIRQAREQGREHYRDAIREVHADNVSLTAIADELDMSYYSLWSAGSTG